MLQYSAGTRYQVPYLGAWYGFQLPVIQNKSGGSIPGMAMRFKDYLVRYRYR